MSTASPLVAHPPLWDPRLGLAGLVAAHWALAAACTPVGVRSGAWPSLGLGDPDLLVFLAAGFVHVHTLLLYPVWTAMGPGRWRSRLAVTTLLWLGLVGAELGRAWWRGLDAELLTGSIWLALLYLGVIVACAVLFRGKWRIVRPPGIALAARAPDWRPQFGIRRLFVLTAVIACLLAVLRVLFPEGIPLTPTKALAAAFGRLAADALYSLALLLPALVAVWAALRAGRRRLPGVLLGALLVLALNGVVFGLGEVLQLRAFDSHGWRGSLAVQLGAVVGALATALAVRACGYRLLRAIPRRER